MKEYHNPAPNSFLLPFLWRVLDWLYDHWSALMWLRWLAEKLHWSWLVKKLSWGEKEQPEHLGLAAIEVYVLLFPLMMGMLLIAGIQSWLVVGLAIYRLIDIAIVVLHHVLAEPQVTFENRDPVIHVKHPSRWIATSLIQVFDIVINFAVLRMFFIAEEAKPGTAFHHSLLVTVFNPPPDGGAVGLESAHLLYSLMFFLVVLPVAINSVRTKLWKPIETGSVGNQNDQSSE